MSYLYIARNIACTRYSSSILGKPNESEYFWMAHRTCICSSALSSTRERSAAPCASGSAQAHSGSGFSVCLTVRRWRRSFSTEGRREPWSAHHCFSSSPSFDPETNSSSSWDSPAAALAARSAASFSAAACFASASSLAFFSAAFFSSSSRFFFSNLAFASSSVSPGSIIGSSMGGNTTSSSLFLGARMPATFLLPPRGGKSWAGAAASSSIFHRGPVGITTSPFASRWLPPYLPPRPPRSSP
mmetsp:Transcript_15716/g.37763  ORF Transcript_15716/g.37763 Transcript_15716/m.37763 type:complete len:243 (-) Transcript_15716:171-899(-)